MPKFTDSTGREWVVEVNVASLKRARTLAGVDLLKLLDGKGEAANSLASDPVALVDALYAIVKTEADARKVTDEEFGRSLAGDALEGATKALVESLVDFFPSARREMLRRAMGKMEEVQRRAEAKASEKLDEMLATMEASLSAAESKSSSGVAPGSSE